MKSTFKILFFLLISLKAQTQCIGDFNTDPCCNEIIRTDPVNPSFARSNDRPYPFVNPTGYLKNNFNWLTPSFSFPGFTGIVDNPFAQPQPSLSRYNTLNNSLGSMTIQQYLDQSPYHPKYGWELITANYNTNLYPDPNAVSPTIVSGPNMILYNKYLSKILILASPGSSTNYNQTIFKVGFDYQYSNANPKSQNLYTACLFNPYGLSQSLDRLLEREKIEIAAAPAGQGDWAFGDAPVSYDPCVCQYPGKMKIETYAYSTSDVKLEGRGIGTEVPFDNSGSPPLQQGRDWLNSVWTVDEWNPGTNKFDWKVNGGLQTYDKIDELAARYKQDPLFSAIANLISTGASLPGLGAIKIGVGNTLNDLINGLAPSFVQKLIDSQARSDIKKTEVTVGQIMSGGASFFSTLAGGGKSNASIMEFEMQMQGRIYSRQKMTGVSDIEFFTPGSYLSNKANTAWTSYPLYNEAMGVFALLNKPSVKYDYAVSSIIYRNQNCYLYDKKCNSPNNVWTIEAQRLDRLFLRLDNKLEYAINPAAEINMSKSKITASFDINLTLYMPAGMNKGPCDQMDNVEFEKFIDRFKFIFNSNSNIFSISKFRTNNAKDTFWFTLSSVGMPIDEVHKFVFEEVIEAEVNFLKRYVAGTSEWKYSITPPRLKIQCDLVHLPNAYGIENKSYHLFTYDIDRELMSCYQDQPSTYSTCTDQFGNSHSMPSGSMYSNVIESKIKFPNSLHSSLSSGRVNLIAAMNPQNVTYNNQNVTVQPVMYFNNLTLTGNTNLYPPNGSIICTLYVKGAFVNNGNPGTIHPNIVIIPNKSVLDDEELNPIDQEVMKEICKDKNKYRANEPVNKLASATPPKSKSDFLTTLTLHPNPSTSLTTLTIENPSAKQARVMVYDLVGREVYSQDMKDVSASNNKVEISTDGWQTGLYIVKVIHGEVEKSIKLEVR